MNGNMYIAEHALPRKSGLKLIKEVQRLENKEYNLDLHLLVCLSRARISGQGVSMDRSFSRSMMALMHSPAAHDNFDLIEQACLEARKLELDTPGKLQKQIAKLFEQVDTLYSYDQKQLDRDLRGGWGIRWGYDDQIKAEIKRVSEIRSALSELGKKLCAKLEPSIPGLETEAE